MCGRIFQIHNIAQLLQFAQTRRVRNAANFNPTYNMGPTNYIPAIRHVEDDDNFEEYEEQNNQNQEHNQSLDNEQLIEDQSQEVIEKQKNKRGLDFFKWGFQTKFNLIINARIEEMHEKHTFKPFLDKKRCVIIADGYYEWNKKKEPFKFSTNKPLYLAAMYTDDDEIFVLTRDAFGEYAKVHDRMPVLLEDDEIDLWINPKIGFFDIIDKKILNSQKKIWGQVQVTKVAPYVNNIKEKSEKCLITLEEYKEQQFKNGIGKFFQKKQTQNTQETQEQLEKTKEKITKSLDD
ncbi:unnamed protein product [Paramecium pentaurelia]|uniref:Uncharacterized protein n=1 Tax=Paramecium pentaurelia TaxID=43138 RepID=A0A8S1S2M7_9CILI|nr:unnamed protein product [Paramecium pentaurelia]